MKKETMRDDRPTFLYTAASLFEDHILTVIEETRGQETKQKEARQFAVHHKGISLEGWWREAAGNGGLTMIHRIKHGREGLRLMMRLTENEKGIDASLLGEAVGWQESVRAETLLMSVTQAAQRKKVSLFIDGENYRLMTAKAERTYDPVMFTGRAIPAFVPHISMRFFNERLLPVLQGSFSNETTAFSTGHKRVKLTGEWQDKAQSGYMEITRKGTLVEPVQKMRVEFAKDAKNLVVKEVCLPDIEKGAAMLRDALHCLDEKAKTNRLGICFSTRSVDTRNGVKAQP